MLHSIPVAYATFYSRLSCRGVYQRGVYIIAYVSKLTESFLQLQWFPYNETQPVVLQRNCRVFKYLIKLSFKPCSNETLQNLTTKHVTGHQNGDHWQPCAGNLNQVCAVHFYHELQDIWYRHFQVCSPAYQNLITRITGVTRQLIDGFPQLFPITTKI